MNKPHVKRALQDIAITAVLLGLAVGVSLLLSDLYNDNNPFAVPVFILAVALIARLTSSYVYGIIASGIGVFCVNYMFTYPLEYTPDTDSLYSDGAYYLLSRIVEKKTGMGTDNFLWKEMLYKLGFQEMAWSHCPMGHVMGATGLYIHSSDMVKLGAVYLNGGTYNGERLISEEWARLAPEKDFALGWDEDRIMYFKGGMCGQKLFVVPKQNRAVAVQSFGGNMDVICDWIKAYKE